MTADSTFEDQREVGRPRPRREDRPLVQGRATYTDDLQPEDALHMAVLRSQHGHARLEGIDVGDAAALDGVAAVYTAADLQATPGDGVIGPIASLAGVDDESVPRRARSSLRAPDRPLLAVDRTHFTGEAIAIVLAEDAYVANDALDLIDVDYDRLEAVTHPEDALESEAPLLHESTPGNLAFDWEAGDQAATDAAFQAADRTVSVDIAHQRISPTPMEPRSALAEYDAGSHELTIRTTTQSSFRTRALMETALGLPAERIRVIAPEVGGAFGCKGKYYPAEPLAAWAAIQTERPVKWQATRTESHRSDIHGRGRTVHAELAFDEDGTIRGLRVESDANLGAYVSRGAPGTRTRSFVDCISGQYAIPAIYVRVRGVLTNTTPVDAYRGSSRPMTILTVERLIDRAARELGIDPAEVRRANFIPPEAFPYDTPVGERYDSGEYEQALDRALEMVDYDQLRERQAQLRKQDRYLGIGLAGVVDNAGTGSTESARVGVNTTGEVTAYCGTADQGQGHRTAFTQLVADLLGVPFDDVTIKEGDTADVPVGGGASGSRSVVMGGDALRAASEAVIDAARPIVARELEVAPADLVFEDGAFVVEGAPERSIDIQTVAQLAARGPHEEGDGERAADEPPIEETVERAPPATFPFGVHVAVVEVDPDTGDVDLRQYVAVDDCGVQLNPTLVEGQIVGGVVNGLGQALWEDAIYDESATLVTGSMQDYAIPRAHQLPEIQTDHTVTPSPYNELGVKGAGESGATGAPAAVANAVADALEPLGVEHVDLPTTPERVWNAVHDREGPI